MPSENFSVMNKVLWMVVQERSIVKMMISQSWKSKLLLVWALLQIYPHLGAQHSINHQWIALILARHHQWSTPSLLWLHLLIGLLLHLAAALHHRHHHHHHHHAWDVVANILSCVPLSLCPEIPVHWRILAILAMKAPLNSPLQLNVSWARTNHRRLPRPRTKRQQ